MTDTPDALDLDLLAQSYVLGDLDDVATAAFEQRLADDQTAREAVERAVAWIEAVSSESSANAPTGRVFHLRKVLAYAAGVAITTALTTVIAIELTKEHPSKTRGADDEAVIASWIEFGELADEDSFHDVEGDLDLESDTDTPSWMFSAWEERNR